jgi:hypothetical protein
MNMTKLLTLKTNKKWLALLLCIPASLAGICSEPPEKELSVWQQKYPKNALISTAKNLEITINIVNGSLEIGQQYYREMLVLAENSASLAESKEYFNDHYKLEKFEAYSLVPDEKQYRKVPVSKFTKTVEIDDYIFYDDQVVYNFSFPAVGKGTKLVTRSQAKTDYPYVPFFFDFGGYVPNENMTVTVSCPRNVSINYHLFGKDTSIVQHSKTEKGDRTIYHWKADNPKVYRIDEKAPDSRYIIPHLIIHIADYTVNNNKKAVVGSLKDLYAYNYSHISNLSNTISPDVKMLTDSITECSKTDRDKVRSIFNWVQKYIKYVAIEDGENGLVPSEASQVFKKRYGDCKGKTSLIVSMIRAAGLKASYAWVGSRERPYRYSVFPSVVNDDHMIAVWWNNEHPVILDGTTFCHRLEDIPAFIQGKECMIEKGKDDFMLYEIPIAPSSNNLFSDSLFIEISDNSVNGRGKLTYSGENKAGMMRLFEGEDTTSYVRILQRVLPKASNKHMVKTVRISDVYDTESPFIVNYTFVLPDFITHTNSTAYINLNLDRFLNDIILTADRDIPLESDMTMEYRYYCKLSLTNGYRVLKLPESTSYSKPNFGFHESYLMNDEYISISSGFNIDFLIIDNPEMAAFRGMLSMINRNYLKSLALEKKPLL